MSHSCNITNWMRKCLDVSIHSPLHMFSELLSLSQILYPSVLVLLFSFKTTICVLEFPRGEEFNLFTFFSPLISLFHDEKKKLLHQKPKFCPTQYLELRLSEISVQSQETYLRKHTQWIVSSIPHQLGSIVQLWDDPPSLLSLKR